MGRACGNNSGLWRRKNTRRLSTETITRVSRSGGTGMRRLRHFPFSPRDVPSAPWEKRIPRSHPVEKGITACTKNRPPLFFRMVAPPEAPPRRPSPPDRTPPLLVVNGMIGTGKIGNRNFWTWVTTHSDLCSFFEGCFLNLYIVSRGAKMPLNV